MSNLTRRDIKTGRRLRLTGTVTEFDDDVVYVWFDGADGPTVMAWEEVLEASRTRKPVNPWDVRCGFAPPSAAK